MMMGHQEERAEKKRMEETMYKVLEGNPSRGDRLKALYNGKILRETCVTSGGSVNFFYKLDDKGRLHFSSTDKPEDFFALKDSYNYGPVMVDVLEDGSYKIFTVWDTLEECIEDVLRYDRVALLDETAVCSESEVEVVD